MPRLEGRDIVCFANDWWGDPLSKKHVMRRLAARNRVLWVNSLGNRSPRANARDLRRLLEKATRFAGGLYPVEDNIHVLSPLAIPSYGSALWRRINALAVGTTVRGSMRRLGFHRPLLYTFVPASAWVAGSLGEEHLVYHCVDEYSAFVGAGARIASLEAELVRRSDLVITCSTPLQRAKALINPNTFLVRHGVDHAHFARALEADTAVPPEVEGLPRPVLGFHGLIAEWVDLELLGRVAEAHPGGSLVLIGEANLPDRSGLDRLAALPNVRLLGRRPYAALPGYCKAFDVALLPFRRTKLTENANPLKLREYLAAGLPVVATAIPEAVALAPFGVHLAHDDDEFQAGITAALTAGPGPDSTRSAMMVGESWDAKVAEIETLLTRLP